MNNLLDMMVRKQRVFQKHHITVLHRVAEDLLQRATIHQEYDAMLRQLVSGLEVWVAKNKTLEKVAWVKRPATWWDMLKEKYLCAFLLKRWPVRYERIPTVVNYYRLCPHIDDGQNLKDHLLFMTEEAA